MDTNNYNMYTMSNVTSIYWMLTVYQVLCRVTGNLEIKISFFAGSSDADACQLLRRLRQEDHLRLVGVDQPG